MAKGMYRSKNQTKNDFFNRDRGGPSTPIDISKIEDQTLQGIEGRIRNLSYEEAYIFDENDKLVAGYKGNKNSVGIPIDAMKEGYTLTHGHPKGMAEFGGTFSWADIDNMITANWGELRATASGQGEMNYILRRTANSNPSGLSNRINQDYNRVESEFERTYINAYKEEIKKGSSDKQASHVARQRGVGVMDNYYSSIMPEYGYEYITREKDYTYNR